MPDDMNIGNLMPIDMEDELKKSFIAYSMAVIVGRALPAVRDGLEPVHRRLRAPMVGLGGAPPRVHRTKRQAGGGPGHLTGSRLP